MSEAARTCHACQDAPSEGLRLLCGGPPNQQNKTRQHAFHIQCWLRAMNKVNDDNAKQQLIVAPTEIGKHSKLGFSWQDLTEDEQATVHKVWNEYDK